VKPAMTDGVYILDKLAMWHKNFKDDTTWSQRSRKGRLQFDFSSPLDIYSPEKVFRYVKYLAFYGVFEL
jgi:hypothetical protein